MEQAQLIWFGHVNRMDEERLTKQVWEARTEGLGMKRPRGRQRRTWNDNIQELLIKKKHHVLYPFNYGVFRPNLVTQLFSYKLNYACSYNINGK
jgi:hypothetical protein